MTDGEVRRGSVGRHVVGLVLFPVIGLVAAIVWLLFTTHVLGVGRSGFGNAAAIVVMPVWAVGMGLVLWLPWWLFHDRRWGRMSVGRAVLSGLVGGLLVSLILMGPAGFTTRGGSVVMGYAVIAIMVVGGMVHNAIVNRARRPA